MITTKIQTPEAFQNMIKAELSPEVTAQLTHKAYTLSFLHENGCYMFEDALVKATSDFIEENETIRGIEVQRHLHHRNTGIHIYTVCEDSNFLYGLRIDERNKLIMYAKCRNSYKSLQLEYEENLCPPRTLGDVFDEWSNYQYGN